MYVARSGRSGGSCQQVEVHLLQIRLFQAVAKRLHRWGDNRCFRSNQLLIGGVLELRGHFPGEVILEVILGNTEEPSQRLPQIQDHLLLDGQSLPVQLACTLKPRGGPRCITDGVTVRLHCLPGLIRQRLESSGGAASNDHLRSSHAAMVAYSPDTA